MGALLQEENLKFEACNLISITWKLVEHGRPTAGSQMSGGSKLFPAISCTKKQDGAEQFSLHKNQKNSDFYEPKEEKCGCLLGALQQAINSEKWLWYHVGIQNQDYSLTQSILKEKREMVRWPSCRNLWTANMNSRLLNKSVSHTNEWLHISSPRWLSTFMTVGCPITWLMAI